MILSVGTTESMPVVGRPEQWPQTPLLLRPTPGSQTVIRGTRFADSTTYEPDVDSYRSMGALPINTGQEKPGKSLVIDFETPLFVGSFLIRIRGIVPMKDVASMISPSDPSYFDSRKRTFQVVVRGHFLQPLRLSECVTGQTFDRPAGRLPGRAVVHAALRLASSLAPQLELRLGSQPRFLAPLLATAHTVLVVQNNPIAPLELESDFSMDDWDLCEPPCNSPMSVLNHLPTTDRPSLRTGWVGSSTDTAASRQASRKRAFNRLASQQRADDNDEPRFDVQRAYTFEFYQHLLVLTDPTDLQLKVANLRVGLSQVLDGQPLNVMAAYRDAATASLTPLWSFDLWHQSLCQSQET